MFPALLSAQAIVSAAPHCPLEHAVYTLRGAHEVTALLRPRVAGRAPFQSNLALVVHSAKTLHTYTFVPFEEGAGAGLKTHLALEKGGGQASITEASNLLGTQIEYFFATSRFTAMQAYIPAKGAEAPPHLFVPGLQELFWYADLAAREAVPISFFDRVTCGGEPPLADAGTVRSRTAAHLHPGVSRIITLSSIYGTSAPPRSPLL